MKTICGSAPAAQAPIKYLSSLFLDIRTVLARARSPPRHATLLQRQRQTLNQYSMSASTLDRRALQSGRSIHSCPTLSLLAYLILTQYTKHVCFSSPPNNLPRLPAPCDDLDPPRAAFVQFGFRRLSSAFS